MKLSRLGNKLPTLGGKVKMLDVTPGATKRLKGPKYQGKDGRNNLFLLYHPICQVCIDRGEGEDARPGIEADHIVPLWEGGEDVESNLQSICISHHREKSEEERKRRIKMMNGAVDLEN